MSSEGYVRKPRCWLVAGGRTITLQKADVTVSRYQGQFSPWSCVMALDDESNPGPNFWATISGENGYECEIIATNNIDVEPTVTLLKGYIEKAIIDFDTRTVTAHGHDRAVEMANKRSDENFVNKSTSDIVKTLATRQGFNVHIDSVAAKAGRTFNEQEFAYNSDLQSVWDVICDCAENDGKVAFVHGDDFYYVDPGNVTGSTYSVHYVPPTPESYAKGNFMTLQCENDVQLSGEITSKVSSWNSEKKEPVEGNSDFPAVQGLF